MDAQTATTGIPHLFSVGPYKLDSVLTEFKGLREFSSPEYTAMGRLFEGETDYNAAPVSFLGRLWQIQIGTVYGKIYKLAPYLLFENKRDADKTSEELMRYCIERFGKPAEEHKRMSVGSAYADISLWDASDGNIVLQTAELDDTFTVSLFLTSRSVRQFKLR